MSVRETFLAHARSILWRAWSTSSEELGSAAVDTLMGLGMLVPAGGAAELERLRLLTNAQPASLSEEQIEALGQAGDRAANDATHERQCACSDWPAACTSGYYAGTWDETWAMALPAVIGVWESMRAPAEADKIAQLQARVAELEDALALAPDPIAYGPRGHRCGCGKDAHSSLTPCRPDPLEDPAEGGRA